MMDFLDTLFGYEYFGPILFGVIAVLIIIFFVILFFGKKDEQERKLEETRKLELANANAFKEEEDTSVKVEVESPSVEPIVEPTPAPVIEEPVKDVLTPEVSEVNPFDSLSTFNESLEENEITQEKVSSVINEVVREPFLQPIETEPLSSLENNINEISQFHPIKEDVTPIEKTQEPEIKIEESAQELKYSFKELASSLSREIEDLEKLTVKKQEPEINDLKLEDVNINVSSIKDIKPNNPRPVFSSVFVEPVNPVAKEEKIVTTQNEVQKMSIPEPVLTPSPEITPIADTKEEKPVIDFAKLKGEAKPNFVKPNIELPKTVEMPVKKSELVEEVTTNMPDFTNIEGESYTLK